MDARSQQLPSNVVRREFGEVNVRRDASGTHVRFLLSPTLVQAKAEGWQTGVALDASNSMRHAFGRAVVGTVPPDVLAEYASMGWAREKVVDGRPIVRLTPEGHAEALRRGLVRPTENVVEPLAREFVALLAERLDEDGGTTVIYWACGDGDGIEVLGDYTAQECRGLQLRGPARFGQGTRLLPAIRYFVDRFRDANKGLYVFLADGNIEDLDEVKRYTTALARSIEAEERHFVKCVLVGVGAEIDEALMAELDDLDTGTGVDVWDHKIARELRSLTDIFAELADEHTIVAPWAKVYDPAGRVVKKFTTGLPARVEVTLPVGADWFELEFVGRRVRQELPQR